MSIAIPRGRLAFWVGFLWEVMSRAGRGYRRFSLRYTGEGSDRRNDKREGEPSLARKARLGLLTKRH